MTLRRPDPAHPRTWYSCRDLPSWHEELAARAHALIDAARDGRWDAVFAKLGEPADEPSDLVNAWRPGGTAEYTPLHHAARRGDLDAARQLLAYGAFRLQRTAAGETPAEVARRHGHPALVALLTPPEDLGWLESDLRPHQHWFTGLVRARLAHNRDLWEPLRLPELALVAESAPAPLYLPVPGLGGGFLLRYGTEGDRPLGERIITADSWSRMASGSEQRHRITQFECRMLPWG